MKLLFVGRDGTLIPEPEEGPIDSLEKLGLMPGVMPALSRLAGAGYRFVICSNQPGLGTERFPEKAFRAPHEKMLELFASQGIRFEDERICPHEPEAGCDCRKPRLGLVAPYLADADWDRDRSAVVGAHPRDIELAEGMGIRGYRVGEPTLDAGVRSWKGVADELLGQSRRASVRRTTKETDISVTVDLDGTGESRIETGLGFFDHMLDQIARHGGIQLEIEARGDLHVDEHHTVEDTALALGTALSKALGDKFGIGRYGFLLPMDEALAHVALDLSGRSHLEFEADFPRDRVGDLPTEMVEHFFRSLTDTLNATLHLTVRGENTHHMVEAAFKGLARALGQAVRKTGRAELPSTKGSL